MLSKRHLININSGVVEKGLLQISLHLYRFYHLGNSTGFWNSVPLYYKLQYHTRVFCYAPLHTSSLAPPESLVYFTPFLKESILFVSGVFSLRHFWHFPAMYHYPVYLKGWKGKCLILLNEIQINALETWVMEVGLGPVPRVHCILHHGWAQGGPAWWGHSYETEMALPVVFFFFFF